MKLKNNNNNALYIVLILSLVCETGFCSEPEERPENIDQYNGAIENIGRFAVQQHNNNPGLFFNSNILLEFGRVVNVKEKVVGEETCHLTLEALDGGEKKMYEAKVWVKTWFNFKHLQEFKQLCIEQRMRPSTLDCKCSL